MTDILPRAGTEIVPGQPMSPTWFNALRNAFRTLQQKTDDISAAQAQIDGVLGVLQDSDGNLIDVTAAIAGKQDASPALDALANLPGSGVVARVPGGYAYATAADLPYDPTTSGLAATDTQAAIDAVAAKVAPPTGTGFRHVVAGVEDAAAVTIDGQSAASGGDVKVVAPAIHAATSKATPVDADELALVDSAASNVLKKLTWANLKATLKTYFDTLYAATGSSGAWTPVKKTAGTQRSSTTTLADDPDLQIIIPAAGTYVIRGVLWFNLGSQTAGVQYGFAYTGSSTQLGYRSNYSTIGSSAGSDNDFSFATAAFPSGNGAGNSAANLRMWVEIVLIATSAGTLKLQWAQSASNALATTLNRGSYLEWMTS